MRALPKEAPPDAFGRAAREYELGRPEWPGEVLDRVVGEMGLGPEAAVLDLGAGTGKLTRGLVPRFARVIAVEPDEAMRAVLEDVVPDAESLPGNAEAIPLPDGEVDAVFSGEAFHWFATDTALAELARVLRPRGGLAILWNIFQGDMEPPLSDEAEELLDEAFARGGVPGLHRVLSGRWREPFAGSAFEDLHEEEFEYDLVIDREIWIARILSVSSMAVQPDESREALAQQLRELVPPGEMKQRFRVVAYWTRLA
ncbi:MAG TPA: class I SAM-dependent methyltransferase [Gaiellaceae bacterium]|nr:class I SAM-dependent methyltransferase [Gaiellaceae bacterium]